MKIGINGFGRIGRAIYRLLWKSSNMYCININEPFATTEDIVYFLKYDSLYGGFPASINIINENTIKISNNNKTLYTNISHFESVTDFCNTLDEETYVIESCGKPDNISYYKNNNSRNAIFTLSNSYIPTEIILGVNENNLTNNSTNIISGSICDTVALAPILKTVFDCSDIKQTIITTMHPALTYQNVTDNYTKKGIDRSLGRQYTHSLIPKYTSAQNILQKFFVNKTINCLSYRVPTDSVCSAVIIFIANKPIDLTMLLNNLKAKKEISFCYDNLVSIDFKGCTSSAVIDMRWLEIIDDSVLRMTIWYDNEYGYSSKIIDLLKLWDTIKQQGGNQ